MPFVMTLFEYESGSLFTLAGMTSLTDLNLSACGTDIYEFLDVVLADVGVAGLQGLPLTRLSLLNYHHVTTAEMTQLKGELTFYSKPNCINWCNCLLISCTTSRQELTEQIIGLFCNMIFLAK